MMGFAANFRLTKQPAQVQEWATKLLDRYDAGELATTTNVEYWAVGNARIEDKEIPDHMRRLWRFKTWIGVATMSSTGFIRRQLSARWPGSHTKVYPLCGFFLVSHWRPRWPSGFSHYVESLVHPGNRARGVHVQRDEMTTL